jgi:hypothetical protein
MCLTSSTSYFQYPRGDPSKTSHKLLTPDEFCDIIEAANSPYDVLLVKTRRLAVSRPSARLRIERDSLYVRFLQIGPSPIFDELVRSFNEAIPHSRFDHKTRWQTMPVNQLPKVVHFCTSRYLTLLWEDATTETSVRQLTLRM